MSSDESHFFFHRLTSAGMDAGMAGHGSSILGSQLCYHLSACYWVEASGRVQLSV